MMNAFFQRLSQWWSALGESGQLALLAVLLGGCIVVATTWLGVRQWWQRWKQERTDDS
jgi:xanthine/uracil/vitamin C permease (AzgA family)